MMPMPRDEMTPLDRWRHDVGQHLDMIRAGAEMVTRHTGHLTVRPDFWTMAEVELDRAERVLTAVLKKVRKAQREYQSKEIAR